MMQTHARPETTQTAELPESLSAASSKLVYLYLSRTDAATVSELSSSLSMQKLELYAILDSLSTRGLVDCDGERYVCAA